SGGLPESRASGILVVNCSFWMGTFWMMMSGWAVSKDLMTLCHTPRSGWAVALFHQVSVTLALLDPPGGPLLHAATAVAVVTATAMAASARLLRMVGHLPEPFESFSITFEVPLS